MKKSDTMPAIKLRGHHLVCLHFFRGEGYNPEFIENLKDFLNRVEAGEELEVCSGPDAVCKVCPYLVRKMCLYEEDAESEIKEMDRKALGLLKLKSRDRIKWVDIGEKIPEIFREWSEEYCNGCAWRKVCETTPKYRKILEAFRLKKLELNFDEIQKAMEDVSRETFDYYLDLVTGEVLTFSEEIISEIESELYDSDSDEIEDDIEYVEFDEEPDLPAWMEDEVELALEILLDEEGRYVRIPERVRASAYKSMSEFIDNVEGEVLRKELSNALNGKGAFRRFKDVLIDYPKERKRWHGFNAKAMKKEIIEWLSAAGAEPVL